MNLPATAQSLPLLGDLPWSDLLLSDHDLAWSTSVHRPDGTWELEGSPAYTALTGFSRTHPADHPLGVSLSPHAPVEQAVHLADALAADTATTLTVEALRADGSPFTDQVVVVPVHDRATRTHLALHRDLGRPADSADPHQRASHPHRRTAWLLEHFDALADAKTITELCSTAVEALVPAVSDWAGILRHPAGRPSGVELLACTTTPSGSAWPQRAVEAIHATGSSMTADEEFATVTVTTRDSVVWTAALAILPPRAVDPAMIRMLHIQLARVAVLAEELGRASHEIQQLRTIESVVLAAPEPLPGLDIAAEMSPPDPEYPQSSWCDAYPIPGGVGLVVSHVYNANTSTLTWSAVARPTLQAIFWRRPDPHTCLLEFTNFAYENIPEIPLSVGQLVTIKPEGENFVIDMASAVYLPLILRIPGEGYRIEGREPSEWYSAGDDTVPMARARLTVPRGTVIAMLTPSLFDGNPTVLASGPDRLVEAWRALPDNAPAAAYADIAVRHSAKKFLQDRCILVTRIPLHGELT
jgi:hypothetical protein